jgi:hypothetical protein
MSPQQVAALASSTGTGAQTTGFNPLGGVGSAVGGLIGGDILGALASSLGLPSAKDLAIRTGLILLGGMLLVVGVFMLAGKQNIQLGIETVAPESRAALATTPSTGRAREARTRAEKARKRASES